MSLPSSNTLGYQGLKEKNPPNIRYFRRAPTVNDITGFDIGDFWIDTLLRQSWQLMNKASGVADWRVMAAIAGAVNLTPSGGGPVAPVANNIDLLGDGNGIQTANGGDGVLNIVNTFAFTPDGGAAVNFVAGNLAIEGAAGIAISNGGEGTINVTPSDDLAAIEALAITGVVSRSAADTWVTSSITDHAVIVGDVGQKLTNVGPLTNGQLLIGSTGLDPVAASLTSVGGSIVITPGAGTLNIESGGGVATTYTAKDATVASPVLGNLNIFGTATNGIATTAAGDTMTIGMASPYADGDFAFTNAVAATPRSVSVQNTDNDPGSYAALSVTTPAGGADPFLIVGVAGTQFYSAGIDNSVAGDPFVLTNNVNPSTGDAIISSTSAGVITLFNDLDVSEGGTGVSTFTDGGLLVGNGAGDIQATTAGTAGQIITSTGAASDPVWTTATYPATIAAGEVVYGSAANVVSALAFDGTATRYLANTGTGATLPEWAQVDLTDGVTGILPVGEGGTGIADPADHSLLVGSGNTALTEIAVGATGTVLIGNTGADPSFSATPSVTSITITNAPAAGTDGANKTYVDTIAAGIKFKNTVKAASTVALTTLYDNGVAGVGATLTNNDALAAFAIDGYNASLNDRILIKDQANTFENGIYTVTTLGTGAVAWVLTRATDYDTPAEMEAGSLVPVQFGTVNLETFWLQTTIVVTVGVDAVSYNQFLAASQASAVTTNTGSFNGWLSAADTNVQAALDTLDDVLIGGTAGQVVTSNGAGTKPTFQAPAAGGMTWTEETGTPVSAAVDHGYILNKNSLVTVNLPATAAVGKTIGFQGSGTGLFSVVAAAGDIIHFGNQDTSGGGSLTATNRYDALEVICIVADSEWSVRGIAQGNLTVA
jgi:hypothetical protein